jgi:glycosyltransferase involved in cell wall biosynthesis
MPPWKRWIHSVVPSPMLEAISRSLVPRGPARIPGSDGAIERGRIDVMHFTLQGGFQTTVPSIYMPYDLQHLHIPEMFSPAERAARSVTYPTLCEQAALVVAISRWGKEDLLRTFHLPIDKVRFVHLAPATDIVPASSERRLAEVRAKYGLPPRFAYYPAQTWRHKNHLTLLEAGALLRDRHGMDVSFVFSGHQNEFSADIERRVVELGLSDLVRFVGFVPPQDVEALYRLSRLLVFPSRFEGFGMPVVEAFRLGVPVACSNVTSLPEVVGDAGVLFDPESPDEIARAVRGIWSDETMRAVLIARGQERAHRFTWSATARRFRAMYRQVGCRRLDEDDHRALSETI